MTNESGRPPGEGNRPPIEQEQASSSASVAASAAPARPDRARLEFMWEIYAEPYADWEVPPYDELIGWFDALPPEHPARRPPVDPFLLQAAAGHVNGSGGQRLPYEAQRQLAQLRERMLSRVLDRDALDTIRPPTPLIAGVLDVGVVAVLAGKFGTYKSFVSIAWACSIATRVQWLGHEVVTDGPVLYVAGEGASGMRARVQAWEAVNGSGARIPPGRLIIYNGRVNLTDRDEMAVFSEIAADIGPALIVFDTLHKCAPGVDEQSSKDMGAVLGVATELVEATGATVLFNHHTGHSGERSRGSSAIEDDPDNSWVIKLSGDGEDRSPANQRYMVHRKAKDRELHTDIPLVLRPIEGSDSCVVETTDIVNPDQSAWLVSEALARKLNDLDVPQGLTIDDTKAYGERLGLNKHARTVWAAVRRTRNQMLADARELSPLVGKGDLNDD